MKKRIAYLLSVVFALALVAPIHASATNDDISPYVFSTYDGQLTLSLDIPSYTSPAYGYTVDAWTCPLKINYRITYDVNSGKISSVSFLESVLTGTALSPTEQGRLVSLNYERVNMSITNGGYSIKCDYFATADLIYVHIPGLPTPQESIRKNVSDVVTVDPPRP